MAAVQQATMAGEPTASNVEILQLPKLNMHEIDQELLSLEDDEVTKCPSGYVCLILKPPSSRNAAPNLPLPLPAHFQAI